MEKYRKEIEINKDRKLIYAIEDGYVDVNIITEYFKENGELKDYSIFRYDDYCFNAWCDNMDEKDTVTFEFEMDHPLYFPLLHLLGDDPELLIDDDDTKDDYDKYIRVFQEDDKIIMEFNNIKENENNHDKFHVFIKNICPDGRSKIDQNYKDTKIRLHRFTTEAYERMMEDDHQITIEEYVKTLKK